MQLAETERSRDDTGAWMGFRVKGSLEGQG